MSAETRESPQQRIQCACPRWSTPRECARVRYEYDYEQPEDACECSCHDYDEDEFDVQF